MLDKLRGQIESIFNERITNPFYGSLIIAWCMWNWEIVYVTIFVDQKLTGNKIDYIKAHYWTLDHVVQRPLYTAAAFVVVFPLLNIGITALHSLYHRWNVSVRDSILKKVRMPLEDSVAMFEAKNDIEKRYNQLLESNKKQVQDLSTQLDEAESEKDNLATQLRGLEANYQSLSSKLQSLTERYNFISTENNHLAQGVREARGNLDWHRDFFQILNHKSNFPMMKNYFELLSGRDDVKDVRAVDKDTVSYLVRTHVLNVNDNFGRLTEKGKYLYLLYDFYKNKKMVASQPEEV